MNAIKNAMILLPLLALLVVSCDPKPMTDAKVAEATLAPTADTDNHALTGATVLVFGPDNVLFVGDSKAGTVHAIETTAEELKEPVPYNLKGVDKLLAKTLETTTTDLMVNDMKIHPVSQEAYIAVQKGFQPDAPAYIAIVSPIGEVRLLDVANTKHSEVSITNPVDPDYTFWKEVPASSLNITDLDYHDGYLYVAGLTNGEFASTLRKIAYPFAGKQVAVGSIEMYHAVHTQMETRAPIRTMLFDEVDGASTLIASYTCTPLVTIPTAEIEEGKHIKAKTIAELGFGNAPIDMISFMAQEMDGSYDKKLLITHKNRGGTLISMKDLAEANKGEGMKGMTMGPAGVPIFQLSTAMVMHVDNQNQMMLASLKRNIDNGGIDLVSELKGSYFRLSDFISEYNFPDYEYSPEQEFTKKYHDMIKPMEGFPELTSDQKGN